MTDSYHDYDTKTSYSTTAQSVVQNNPLMAMPWQYGGDVPPLPTSLHYNAGPSSSSSQPPFNPAHQYQPPAGAPPTDHANYGPPPAYAPPLTVSGYPLPPGPPPAMVFATPLQPYTYPSPMTSYPPNTILVPVIATTPSTTPSPPVTGAYAPTACWRWFWLGTVLTMFVGPLSLIKLATNHKMGLMHRKMYAWGVFTWMFVSGCFVLIFGKMASDSCYQWYDPHWDGYSPNNCAYMAHVCYGIAVFFFLWAMMAASLVKLYRRSEWAQASVEAAKIVQQQPGTVVSTAPTTGSSATYAAQHPPQQQYGVGVPVQMQVLGAYR